MTSVLRLYIGLNGVAIATIDARLSDTIGEINSKAIGTIKATTSLNLPVEQLCLVFKQEQLDDRQTLGSYNDIQDGSHLQLVPTSFQKDRYTDFDHHVVTINGGSGDTTTGRRILLKELKISHKNIISLGDSTQLRSNEVDQLRSNEVDRIMKLMEEQGRLFYWGGKEKGIVELYSFGEAKKKIRASLRDMINGPKKKKRNRDTLSPVSVPSSKVNRKHEGKQSVSKKRGVKIMKLDSKFRDLSNNSNNDGKSESFKFLDDFEIDLSCVDGDADNDKFMDLL